MNKCKKCFVIYILNIYRVNSNYVSKCKILQNNISKIVVKTCENDLSNTILVIKVKVELLHRRLKSHITKQLLTSLSVDIRMYPQSFI